MDIAALSINMSQSKLFDSVQLSLMKMTMENTSDISEEMNKMIVTSAIDPNIGNNLDVLI